MKNWKSQWTVLVLAWLAGFAEPARAQVGVGSPPGWNAAMTRLFGDIKAFSAKAEFRIVDRAGKESLTMPMNIALLDRKVRLDIEMTRMKGPQAPPEQIAGMKQMAMDRLACVILPETKMMQIIFPALGAYVEMPLPEEEAAALTRNFRVDRTPLGKETIDGHPCAKNRVRMTDDQGQKIEFIVWSATDMKDFPLQAQMNDAGGNIVIRYKNVQLVRPDANQFGAPSGYTKHRDFLQLMQAAAGRQLGNAPKKK